MNVEGKELGLRVKWGSYYTWAKVHPPYSYHTITTTHSFRHNIWFTKYVFSLVSMPLTMEILEISKIFVTILRDKTICSINHSIWERIKAYLIRCRNMSISRHMPFFFIYLNLLFPISIAPLSSLFIHWLLKHPLGFFLIVKLLHACSISRGELIIRKISICENFQLDMRWYLISHMYQVLTPDMRAVNTTP